MPSSFDREGAQDLTDSPRAAYIQNTGHLTCTKPLSIVTRVACAPVVTAANFGGLSSSPSVASSSEASSAWHVASNTKKSARDQRRRVPINIFAQACASKAGSAFSDVGPQRYATWQWLDCSWDCSSRGYSRNSSLRLRSHTNVVSAVTAFRGGDRPPTLRARVCVWPLPVQRARLHAAPSRLHPLGPAHVTRARRGHPG